MATAQEKVDIKNLQSDVGDLRTDVAVIKTDMHYVKNSADKMEKFIDENRAGITTSSLLNNKITTIVLGGMVAVGMYFAAKGGW